jgi:hypothetical protein
MASGGAPVSSVPIVSGPIVCPQCGAAAIAGEAFCDNCGAPLNAPAHPAAPVPVPPYSSGLPPQASYPPPQQVGAPTPPPIINPVQQPLVPPGQTPPPTLPPGQTPPPTLPMQSPPAYQSPPAPPSYTAPPVAAPPVYQSPPTPPSYTAPPVVTTSRTTLAPARLVLAATGATLSLPATVQAVIGRGDPVSNFFPDIDLTPHGALDNGVGRRHVRLFVQGGQVMIEDMDSTNGTVVNGQKLAARQPQLLRDGDQILLGKLLVRFHL